VKKALDEKGLARGAKQHELMLPRSERNGSIVEPMISTQWFVKMQPLADPRSPRCAPARP
jgi:valyl-tRNA synthetase